MSSLRRRARLAMRSASPWRTSPRCDTARWYSGPNSRFSSERRRCIAIMYAAMPMTTIATTAIRIHTHASMTFLLASALSLPGCPHVHTQAEPPASATAPGGERYFADARRRALGRLRPADRGARARSAQGRRGGDQDGGLGRVPFRLPRRPRHPSPFDADRARARGFGGGRGGGGGRDRPAPRRPRRVLVAPVLRVVPPMHIRPPRRL